MKSQILKKKIKGSALAYSLLIFLTATAIVSNLVLLQSSYNKQHHYFDNSQKLIRNCYSGFELLLSNDFEFEHSISIDLFDNEKDSVSLKKFNWGFFKIGYSKSFDKNKFKEKIGLIGCQNKPKNSLFITDYNKEISISGNTRLEGNILVPKKGLKRGYFGKTDYLGEKLYYGKKSSSNRSFPLETNELIIETHYEISELSRNDTLIYIEDLYTDSLSNSFDKKTLNLIIQGDFDLNSIYLNGNIKLICDGELNIRNNSKLNNILVSARKINIEQNFNGRAQLFATDSIYIGSNVQLTYPSIISLNSSNKGLVEIDTNTRISGSIYISNEQNQNSPVLISYGKSVFQGDIYINGTIDYRAKLIGNLTCDKVAYINNSSVNENAMFQSQILPSLISSEFLFSPIIYQGKKQVIEWL